MSPTDQPSEGHTPEIPAEPPVSGVAGSPGADLEPQRGAQRADWTVGPDGRSNTSGPYLALCDVVEHIRHLLSPERAARRPQPAPDRPWLQGWVDHRPVRVYPAPDPSGPDEALERVAADQAALRQARATGRVIRIGGAA